MLLSVEALLWLDSRVLELERELEVVVAIGRVMPPTNSSKESDPLVLLRLPPRLQLELALVLRRGLAIPSFVEVWIRATLVALGDLVAGKPRGDLSATFDASGPIELPRLLLDGIVSEFGEAERFSFDAVVIVWLLEWVLLLLLVLFVAKGLSLVACKRLFGQYGELFSELNPPTDLPTNILGVGVAR